MKGFWKAGSTQRYVDNKKTTRPLIYYFLTIVVCIVASWLLFACLWLAISKSRLRRDGYLEGHDEDVDNINSNLMTDNINKIKIDGYSENKTANTNIQKNEFIGNDGVSNRSSKCVEGVDGLQSALMFAIETQTTLGSNYRRVKSTCTGALFLVLLQISVGFILQGLLFGVFFWRKISIPSNRLFEFDDKLLIEEIKQFNSKKMFVLHFKLKKISQEIISNIVITARLLWTDPVKKEHEVSLLNDHDDEENNYSLKHQSTELLKESEETHPKHNLELSYDKIGTPTTTFHMFPWPHVLFHQINSKSPLWKIKKSLRKNSQKSGFKIELTVKGFKGSLADSFSVTYTYVSSDITYLDEFISHVIFGRNIDTDGNYNLNL